MRRISYALILVIILLCGMLLTACNNDCAHQYSISKTIAATCTKEGYTEYKCSECGETYKTSIPAKGHIAGEAPTLDAPQVCIVCGTVLAKPVDYMPFRANDLQINHYYGYSDSFVTTQINTQNLDRYTTDPIQYINKNGDANYLNLSIPIQDFYNHSVSSILPLSTSDGKTYRTDSGFKTSFSFSMIDKAVDSIHAWGQGLSSEYKGSDVDLLKIVGAYQANPTYYNTIYELVDFSDCYIEIAKQTTSGYEIVKKIHSKEDWRAILETGSIDISNDNGALFYEPGKYRIMFKYNITWISDPPSAVYDMNDASKSNPIYPYGKLNDQYEYFYIDVTENRNHILLPSNLKVSDWGFFCQLRAAVMNDKSTFIADHSALAFSDGVVFKIGAKLDMTKNKFFYNKRPLDALTFTLSIYDTNADSYREYKVYDLMPQLSQEIVCGEEITVEVGRESALRDQKCKITITYSFTDDEQGKSITEQQNYYYTLHW